MENKYLNALELTEQLGILLYIQKGKTKSYQCKAIQLFGLISQLLRSSRTSNSDNSCSGARLLNTLVIELSWICCSILPPFPSSPMADRRTGPLLSCWKLLPHDLLGCLWKPGDNRFVEVARLESASLLDELAFKPSSNRLTRAPCVPFW